MRRVRIHGAVGLLAVLAAMVGAAGMAPAQAAPAAAPAVRYVGGSNWQVGPYQWKTDAVRCPAGMKAIGGGEDNSSTGAVLLQRSEPTADGDGWRIAVRNTGSTVQGYRAWAMCTSAVTGYHLSGSGEVNIPGHGTEYVVGRCPQGPQAILGFGFHTSDNATVGANTGFVYNWSIYSFEANTTITNLSAEPVVASTVTICGGGFEMRDPIGPGVVARPGETVSATATCPAGTTLIGGGIAHPRSDGYPAPAGAQSYLVDSQPLPITSTDAVSWRATVYNAADTNETVHAQALCAG